MESKEQFTTTTTPLSPPPVYQRPNFRARLQELLNTFWIYEIVASLISLFSLAAIFIILHHYDSWIVDLWSHSWSLNSVVGLLATISQITMAVPLASGISQLKWTWYKESQKLTDLDKFDQSSRGPFGSVRLLFSRPFKFLGAFGAILTILTLAFHALIQDALSARTLMVRIDELYGTDDGASYPQGNNYTERWNDYSSGATLYDQGPSLNMVADINYGMYYPFMNSDTQFQLILAHCTTGNCTWKHVQTLSDDISGVYTLYGNKVEMDQEDGLVTSLGDALYPDPSVLPDVGPLIAHITTMAREYTNDAPIGIDCALWWCVLDQTDVEMINWNITNSTNTVWTDPSVTTTHAQAADVILTPPTCYDKYAEEIDPSECTKTISSHAQLGLQNYFIGDKTGFTGKVVKNFTTDGWAVSSEAMQVLYTTTRLADSLVDEMETLMENIGFMMTSNVRQATPQVGVSNTLGDTWWLTTVYHIRWGFLVLPTMLVVASILFLIVTIIKSWGHEKWKSSVLPLLFHPLAYEVRPGVAPHKMSELKAVAENKQVRLERTHVGSQFV